MLAAHACGHPFPVAMDIQRLRLIIDSAPAAEGAAQWSRYTRQVGQDAVQAGASIAKMESAMDSAARTMRTVAMAGGVALGVHQVIEYADTWKLVEGRLRIVTSSTKDLRDVQGQLFGIAQNTRTTYEDIANTYARIARSTRDLNVSESDLMRTTETLSKAITISGVTTQQARAGMIQLGQAFAIGRLQGQDMRMLFEDIPRVGLAISEGLHVPIGALKEMGSQGKLTSEMVLKGLLASSAAIDQEFQHMPVTVGQATTQLANAMQKFVGEQDHGIGATASLSAAISLLARNFTVLGNAVLLFGAAKLSGLISGLIGPTIEEAKQLALGNAVLLNSREAHLMRAAAAKEASAATLTAAQNATTGLRAELAAITQLQVAERARFAEATARVRRAVPEGQLAPLGGAVQMRDNAQVVQAMKQRAESEALLVALSARRVQVQMDLNAVDAIGAAAARANTAANIQRAMAMNVSTAAMIASTVAARAAAVATGLFNQALALVGGPIGVAVLALMLFVGWLLKKQSAEADAIQESIKHTSAMREQKTALEALHAAMVEDVTDINKQQQALDANGLKGLDRAKEEIKARDLARKYWKAYQEALKEDNGYDATVAKELTLERALKSSSATVRAAAQQRVEYAGLVIGADVKLAAAEKAAKDAAEKRKQASDEATRKLKEEADARKKAMGDLNADTAAVLLNAAASGQSRQVRAAWALQAKIDTEIHNKHAEAVQGDTASVVREKAALRDEIATQLELTDSLERLTKARNTLRDASDDASVDLAQAEAMADAWKKGAAAVERLKIEQSADNAIRQMTVGLTADQTLAMQDELNAYRQKLILLGQLNVANQAAASAQKQDIQVARQEAKELANESEQLVKNALRGAQKAMADFFESVLSGGVNSFGKLVDAMRSMFVRLFAELITMQLGKQLVAAVAAVAAPPRLLRGGTTPNGPTWQQRGLVYGTSALAGGTLGYGIGQSAGNNFMAGAGGALSGAAAGFAVGGPVGAVIGGVAGLVGGLLGHAAKIKAEREAMEKARKEFFTELDKFVYGITEHTGLERGLHDLQQQFTDLLKKANDLGLGYSDLSKASKAVADATARMKAEFLASIDAQIRSAEGRGYVNDAIDAQQKYQDNLKDIALAGGDVSKAVELFTKQIDQLAKGLTVPQIEDLIRQLPALTKGMDPVAAKALADVLNNDLTDAMAAAAKAAASAAEELQRAAEDLQVRFTRTQGGTGSLMSLEFAQRREMADASGASPAYIAQLHLVHLFEMAQAKIQEQTDAQVKAIQDATHAEQDRLDALAKIAQDALHVQEDALGVAQQSLSATEKVVQSLIDYGNSLVTGDLSPLSPVEKYQESGRQLEEAFTNALAGDRDSALKVPELANLFLQLSHGYNASGPAYVEDFTRVQDILAALNDKYSAQQTTEQQMVTTLQQQVDLLHQQIDSLAKQSDDAATAAAAQIAALQDTARIQQLIRDDVVAALESERDAELGRLDAQLIELQGMKDRMDSDLARTDAMIYEQINQRIVAEQNGAANVDGFNRQIAELIVLRQQQQEARDKVGEQIDATNQVRDGLQASSDAQVAAIMAGASFTDLGFKSLEVLLAQQHAAKVEADQAAVQAIVAAVDRLAGRLVPEALDGHPWRPTRPGLHGIAAATDAGVAQSVVSSIQSTPEVVTALREVVNELKGIRRDNQVASTAMDGRLSQLSLDFGDLAQQARFEYRENV